MIWKNPFSIKNSEQQDKYLSLFDADVLDIIQEENLEKVSYVSSTPGAGKTSLFHSFSPQVLSFINKNDTNSEYADIRKQMQRLGAINDGRVTLLSASLSCATGYSIIEEMFENGRRSQVLFALLNYRIIIIYIKSLRTLLEIDEQGLEDVTFRQIPVEMLSVEENFKNALAAYKWACNGEKELCRYLDSNREEGIELSFVHTTLLAVKLFEADNILLGGEKIFLNSILIFDDFHKMTERQRKIISEAFYTLKSKTGVWLGQRLEGLSNLQVVSMDGSLCRDYNPNIIIDNYWSRKDKGQSFYKILETIANKRVRESDFGHYSGFGDCLSSLVNEKEYKEKLTGYIEVIKEELAESPNDIEKFEMIQEYIDNAYKKKLFLQTIAYECLKIKKRRDGIGQLSLFFGEKMTIEEFDNLYKEVKDAAEFYVCYHCGIPFYYGINRLKVLSSYNIEQFLFFSAGIFEICRVKLIGNNRGKNKSLTVEEQDKSIRNSAEKKWNDMDNRYGNINQIKTFLNKIAQYGENARDKECASYAGGAYTGFAVKTQELSEYADKHRDSIVIQILGQCLSSKYLERKDNNSGESTFYLNRWLCVHYNLPLAYGGFKRCNVASLEKLCSGYVTNEPDEQMSFLV